MNASVVAGIAIAALWIQQANAAAVMKCVDSSGKVTFTQGTNCPVLTTLDEVVSVKNQKPSGSGAPVMLADPDSPIYKQRKSEPRVVSVPVVKEVEAIEPERYSPVKKTDRKIRTMSRPQTPQVTLEERTVRSTKTNRDGSKTGTATKVWVPVVR